ncbi:MAG TPA: TonB-dependent receptor [Acidobacteriaceae bacterium]
MTSNTSTRRPSAVRWWMPIVLLAAWLIAAIPQSALAQTGQGSITGRVTDPKGALVGGASVVITNTETNVQNTTKTNGAGIYNVQALNPGIYSVAVTSPGFQRAVIDKVTVSEANTVQTDVPLAVGGETTTVTVSAQASLLSNTSDVVTTVDHELVESLPYPERSSLEAVLLVPGVNGDPTNPGGISTENPGYTTGFTLPGASIAVGGTPPGGTGILVDGSDVTQASYPRTGVNLSGQNVGETSVIVSGLSSKYGRTGSGIIIQGSRAGTNIYHGGISWRHTDPFFNAFPLGGTIKNDIHQNFYGFYLGGPIRIPKIYNGRDKSFFFLGIEPARLANRVGFRGTFQTPADLAGHLNDSLPLLNQTILRASGYAAALAAPRVGGLYYQSATNADGFPTGPAYTNSGLYRPITGPLADCGQAYIAANPTATSCPNDVAPQLSKNTFAQYVLSQFPSPSNPGPFVTFDSPDGAYKNDGTNGSYLRGVQNIDNRYSFRIDHYFNNSNRIFVRYTVIPVIGKRYLGLDTNNPLNNTPTDSANAHDIAFGYSHVFSNNIVNDFHYSFMRDNQQRLPPPSALSTDFSAKYGLTPAVLGKGFPSLGNFNTGGNAVSYTLQPANLSGLSIQVDQNFIAGDDITWTHGKHLFQFGADIRWIQSNQYDLSGLYGGKYTFAQAATNNGATGGMPLATFILGNVSGYSNTPVSIPGYYRWHYYAGYFQDDWRITPRLTINAGMRYELEMPRQEKYNNQGFVAPFAGSLNGMPTSVAFCFSSACGFQKSLWPANYHGFEPRIGFSFAATRRTTLRASYTLTRVPLSGYENIPDPDYNVASVSVGGINGGVTANQVVNYITNPVGPLTSAYTSLNGARGPLLFSTGIAPSFVTQKSAVPYIQTYGLTVQFQPASRTLIQATYQGVKGTHLIGVFSNALNVPSIPTVIAAIQQQQYLGGVGTTNTYGITQNGALIKETNLQKLYPYQNFFNQNLPEIYPRNGTLEYNGMYLSVNQRMTKDLTFLANYTWSKSLDNIPDTNGATGGGFGVAPQQNPLDMQHEYSVSSFDQPSKFRAGYNYKLPFGIGEQFRTGNGFIDRLIGDFSTSGIMGSASGYPNFVTLGTAGYFTSLTPGGLNGCTAAKGQFCQSNALPSTYTLRPDIIPGVPLINPKWKNNPFGLGGTGSVPYINAAAFAVPGTINNPALGNAPRTLSNARSPREFTFDAHVQKGITIRNGYKLSLTANLINAFNHPVYFGIANHTILSTTTVNATTGSITNTNNANFSVLNQGTTAGMSRVVQFGAQFTF